MANIASKFQYKCDGCGAEIYSEREYKKCPILVPKPCKGTLNRFGPGSKTKEKE